MDNLEILYPKIHVYHNMFRNIDDIETILDNSRLDPSKSLFKQWKDWYTFGYLCDTFDIKWFRNSPEITDNQGNIFDKSKMSDQNIKELEIFEDIIKNFWNLTKQYADTYNLNISNFYLSGPNIPMYLPDRGVEPLLAMQYHTDYQYDKEDWPGEKLIITCTMYLNDNYNGGEISFAVQPGVEINYKPKAGDVIIFPSGHPNYLQNEINERYLHGVKKITGGKKYFVRSYLSFYQDGSKEWYNGLEKYGEQLWLEMKTEEMKQKQEKLARIRRDLGYNKGEHNESK